MISKLGPKVYKIQKVGSGSSLLITTNGDSYSDDLVFIIMKGDQQLASTVVEGDELGQVVVQIADDEVSEIAKKLNEIRRTEQP